MPDLASTSWALTHLSISALALFLLERAHKDAMQKLIDGFDCERKQHQLLVAFLEAAVMRQEDTADA